MTQGRKLKKAVRARARKTGESYSSARRQVLEARARRAAAEAAPVPKPPASVTGVPPRPAPERAGGLSDLKAREKTGHGLDHWFEVLDAFGAPQKGHTAAARHLHEEHGVPGWYCQGITVAYERSRGLRDVNQSCEGRFQVSVSRVVPASVTRVRDALRARDQRSAWLPGTDPELVAALRAGLEGPKGPTFVVREKGDARLRYKWGKSTVEIRVDARGPGKARIVADNSDLPAADLVAPRRRSWQAALDSLRRYLSSR